MQTFRFFKTGVYALVDMLHDQLHFPTERGRPLTVLQQVLVALNHCAGGQFQRTTAHFVEASLSPLCAA
jgi:hypothetical protein